MRPEETPDMAKKRPVVHLEGTGTAKKAKATFEVRITDAMYEVGILKDDIKNKRVWFEAPPDADGWMKLLYSADGPTGDPIPIGKIKFDLDTEEKLDQNFGDFSDLTINEAKKE
jgi:hypothetical protein